MSTIAVIALKRILVPVDFSEASEAAIRYGVALGRAFDATLHLLHAAVRHELQVMVERQRVIDLFLSEGVATKPPTNAAHELLATLLTAEEQQAVRAEYVLRASGPGGPYMEIVRYAKERDIDLIVMGTHGRGAMAHLLMGSVAERVVRTAPCPVLTVRRPEHEFVLPDALVAVAKA
jgi:nucleotide-binding universal stress UspA family protein